MTTYHPAKFREYRHCYSGDLIFLFCHVILDDHVMKVPCAFMGGSPFVIYSPDKFGGHRRLSSGDVTSLSSDTTKPRYSRAM